MKTIMNKIKGFLNKPLVKISPLLFSLSFFSACNNPMLDKYNKDTEYIHKDFSEFIEEHGKIEKEGMSYSATINNKAYLVVKGDKSLILSVEDNKGNSKYWIDYNSNGMRDNFLEGDSYKSNNSKEDRSLNSFSKEEQLNIASDYTQAELYILHNAEYKEY